MNKETKFTQGEWEYAGGDNGSCEINIGETTASVCRWDKNSGIYVISREEMEANAHLIAAAPDLLDALRVCHASLMTYGEHIIIDKQVKNAINKALL